MTAVLAVQGDFFEHERALASLGEPYFEIRCRADAEKHFDRLVLPGGESTVQRKLVTELGLYDILRERIAGTDDATGTAGRGGIPVLATCAGLILLADYFRTLPVTVKRNAYGRQTGSFATVADFSGIGTIPMTFIRAPAVEEASSPVTVKSIVDGRITGVQYKKQIGIAFHPEMDADSRLYQYFLSL